MRWVTVISLFAAALVHAALLFGVRLGTMATALPASDDPSAVDVSLVDSAPAEANVAPTPPVPPDPPPEPTPPPAPTPIPEPTPEMVEPQPTAPPISNPTPAPEPPRPIVHPTPARKTAVTARTTPAAHSNPNPAAGGRRVGVVPGSGTSAHPRYRSNPTPEYPPDARRNRQQGVVLLSVEVGADGHAGEVALRRSSGFSALDDAALHAVRRWTFDPARVGGLAVSSRVDVPVRFTLAR